LEVSDELAVGMFLGGIAHSFQHLPAHAEEILTEFGPRPLRPAINAAILAQTTIAVGTTKTGVKGNLLHPAPELPPEVEAEFVVAGGNWQ